ncbi:hypothetical protein [Emergencia sp. 1XD21-10]|uniref:hypothetical protein n=1 Tax=Emergencia sp. 1XD21-10 TaxID=2304569 RepID=UPI00137A7673|nr:hypothetical protein [Emergencia sp. 1XD21-10]MCI9639830.1 hypothetical protein [Emergencia sp.]NCE97785.1 hypothetical protein [Emergencia sp. 1XD21-10]
MKEIQLRMDPPFFNSVDVAVLDFPKGLKEVPRQRCKITVEFAAFDVKQLQKQGLNFEAAIEHYKTWLYEVVKVHLAQDWICIGGWDQVMALVESRVKAYYDAE